MIILFLLMGAGGFCHLLWSDRSTNIFYLQSSTKPFTVKNNGKVSCPCLLKDLSSSVNNHKYERVIGMNYRRVYSSLVLPG